jgi:cobalamin biosynthesis Co2+ chelatase CbiK
MIGCCVVVKKSETFLVSWSNLHRLDNLLRLESFAIIVVVLNEHYSKLDSILTYLNN